MPTDPTPDTADPKGTAEQAPAPAPEPQAPVTSCVICGHFLRENFCPHCGYTPE